jgi:enediyne polyketide synthase
VARRAAEVWRDLLGDQRHGLASFVARQADEDDDAAATRVWAALECLTKAGAGFDVPLVYRSQTADGWVILSAGELAIATWVAAVQGADAKLAFAVLAGKELAIG